MMNPQSQDGPISDFSQCHAGIFRKLDQLGELCLLARQPGSEAEASRIAERLADFFRAAMFEHHLDEERELFPAALAQAQPGDERERVQAMSARLSDEHRDLEQQWERIESALRRLAQGQQQPIADEAVERFVAQYRAHARFEEGDFLPLAQTVLARSSDQMAALGLSLHMRHAFTEVASTYY